MQLLRFHSIPFSFFLIIGILIAHNLSIDIYWSLASSVALTIGLCCLWWLLRNKIIKTSFFALISYLCIISLGIHTYNIQIEINRNNHYSKFLNSDEPQIAVLKLKERLKPSTNYHKYVAEVVRWDNHKTIGNILVNLNKASKKDPYNIDDYLYVKTPLLTVGSPKNPHQFNYKAYLKLRNIHHQVYLKPSDLLKSKSTTQSVYGYADKLRKSINKHLEHVGFNSEVLGIMNAMILGQRQDLDSSIYNNYVNSGTIHILAVSGLHVGIILLILNSLFRPLLYVKHGRIIKSILIIAALWVFAIIAGLSPSVTRAVAMFSIISFAMHLERPTNIYNTLAISAFVILLFKPFVLFQVGFQMSYAAVIGIVSIQPKLYGLLHIKIWVFDKLWQIVSVSIAAQLAVLPISLYYFHQFPGLFFMANVVVIPFLGLILGLGLVVIVLSVLNLLPHFIFLFYSLVIEGLNDFIAWIASFEDFLLRDIPFTGVQLVICYGIIISLIRVLISKNLHWLIVGLCGVLALQTHAIIYRFDTKTAFIIFNKSRHTVIGQHSNKGLILYHNLDSLSVNTTQFVRNYAVGENIKHVHYKPLESVYGIQNTKLLAIDSTGVYKHLSFTPDYVLLRNSPKININRLIDSLAPKVIIADGSNYTSYVKRWKASCQARMVLFHHTATNGAFILDRFIP